MVWHIAGRSQDLLIFYMVTLERLLPSSGLMCICRSSPLIPAERLLVKLDASQWPRLPADFSCPVSGLMWTAKLVISPLPSSSRAGSVLQHSPCPLNGAQGFALGLTQLYIPVCARMCMCCPKAKWQILLCIFFFIDMQKSRETELYFIVLFLLI